MSQIISIRQYGFAFLIALLAFVGCGTPNDQAPFDAAAGKHSSDWVYAKHAAASKVNDAACTECHGSDLAGGLSGVACSQCHLNGSPYTLTGCTSCHGNPPTGAVAPDRSGAHAAHNALPNVENVCKTCHHGAGSGSPRHYNGSVDVAFLSAYNAKSGAAVGNADGTCSKVSCHGGQTTPGWLSGATINVDTQCTSCHTYGTTEYNGFSSGEHDAHVNGEGFACTVCHDTTTLAAGHFTHLNTSAIEGPAAATLNSFLNYDGTSCNPGCHATRDW